ncbi:MAG: tRNA (guanosine(46)-N7)-methyltransferase TrmB [Planctomycetes bacterium]|nr:tRNA (guanosine(46)-N7)-methyltransferase TrmB [Planctomycetota bacterium]
MVSTGMKRYRVRTAAQSALIGDQQRTPIDAVELFGRRAPLRLEIGFGHGEFLSQMAAVHPDEDFIGVEHNDLRVTKTAHKSLKLDAHNVRLFNDEAHRFVRFRIAAQSLARCYILFPDPWPKPTHRRRRLMSRAFLHDLSRAMAPGGLLVFASDTHNYVFQVLSNLTTLPGLWTNRYQPAGYRFDIPTRFPTLFERYKKSEGCSIGYVLLERTANIPTEQLPWREPQRIIEDRS